MVFQDIKGVSKRVYVVFLVSLQNPQSVVMDTYDPSDDGTFSGTYDNYGILSAEYWFSELPVLGNWKVKVKYGHKVRYMHILLYETFFVTN